VIPVKTKMLAFSTGLAMFSMFFGSGNLVFPLLVGQLSEGHFFIAALGILLTGVLVPFIGILAMFLFKGNQYEFFSKDWAKILKSRYYFVPFFDENLSEAYSAADLVIARAGASTIFELAAKGKPSILIPLAIAAQNHQELNAYNYADTGAATVIEEENIFSNSLKIRIGDNMKKGAYPITANVYSDDGKLRNTITKDIKVEDCVKSK